MIFSFTISKKEKKKSTLEITIGGGKKDLKKKTQKKNTKLCVYAVCSLPSGETHAADLYF